jgi:hypothetical protein
MNPREVVNKLRIINAGNGYTDKRGEFVYITTVRQLPAIVTHCSNPLEASYSQDLNVAPQIK